VDRRWIYPLWKDQSCSRDLARSAPQYLCLHCGSNKSGQSEAFKQENWHARIPWRALGNTSFLPTRQIGKHLSNHPVPALNNCSPCRIQTSMDHDRAMNRGLAIIAANQTWKFGFVARDCRPRHSDLRPGNAEEQIISRRPTSIHHASMNTEQLFLAMTLSVRAS
jgi:hypothetical protein